MDFPIQLIRGGDKTVSTVVTRTKQDYCNTALVVAIGAVALAIIANWTLSMLGFGLTAKVMIAIPIMIGVSALAGCALVTYVFYQAIRTFFPELFKN